MSGVLYTYIDESGDLGYSHKSSSHFVMGAIVTKNRRCVEKIPKKIRQKVLKKSKRRVPELKANSSDERVRKKVLEELSKCKDTGIIWLWINKKHTYERVKRTPDTKAYHYNYLMGRIVELVPYSLIQDVGKITLLIDLYFKSKRVRRDELEKYLKKLVLRKKMNVSVDVLQIDSVTNNGLQVVDFVAYAFFRCIERGDCIYQNILDSSELTIIKKQIY